MSSGYDDRSHKSASEASDDVRARISNNDDHSPSKYKKSRRDGEKEREFEEDYRAFKETDKGSDRSIDPELIGMMYIDENAALKVDVHQCMLKLNKM